jgi:hypothetical protein
MEKAPVSQGTKDRLKVIKFSCGHVGSHLSKGLTIFYSISDFGSNIFCM